MLVGELGPKGRSDQLQGIYAEGKGKLGELGELGELGALGKLAEIGDRRARQVRQEIYAEGKGE